MNVKHINPISDQVMYRPLSERYSLLNEVILRKPMYTLREVAAEPLPSMKEVTDIIFKSVNIVNQLEQKALNLNEST
jgi:hypothetical protein